MIPDEAVEAAAEALRDALDWGVDGFEEQAKRALEAAAPHLMEGLRAELAGLAEEFNTTTIDQFGIRRNARDQLMQIVHQHLGKPPKEHTSK